MNDDAKSKAYPCVMIYFTYVDNFQGCDWVLRKTNFTLCSHFVSLLLSYQIQCSLYDKSFIALPFTSLSWKHIMGGCSSREYVWGFLPQLTVNLDYQEFQLNITGTCFDEPVQRSPSTFRSVGRNGSLQHSVNQEPCLLIPSLLSGPCHYPKSPITFPLQLKDPHQGKTDPTVRQVLT